MRKHLLVCLHDAVSLIIKASGWLNKPDVAICKLEQVLYWHNLKVFNALYQNKCPRLLEYVEIAKQYQLEPNDCVNI